MARHRIDEVAGKSGPGPLTREDWEHLFRCTQVPLFVEDLATVRPLIDQAVVAAGNRGLRAWLDAHPDAVMRFIMALQIIDANQAAVELNAAASREELLVSLDRLVLPETLVAFKEMICLVAAGAEVYEGECRYRALDGREYQTLNRAWIPARNDPNQLLVIATVDITDLNLAKQALRDSEERYRLLVEMAHDVILRHDLSGRVTFVNQAGIDLLGIPREEFIGLNVTELLTPDGLVEDLRRRTAREAGEKGCFVYETEYLRGDGRPVPIEVSSSLLPGPLYGAEGPQVLVMARDVSGRRRLQREQRLAEARQRDSQKLESLGVLARGVAHDFNNLLATIVGETELLREKMTSDPEQTALAAIQAAGQQAAELCRQMQAFAGAGTGIGPLPVRPQDLSHLVADIQDLLRVAVSASSNLHFDLASGLPAVQVDSVQIRQVIMNLVSNAAESLAESGGEIRVSTGAAELSADEAKSLTAGEVLQPGLFVYCEVRDSGSGMNHETMLRIFEPFYTTRGMGRGLGLAAALGIVRAHRGAFGVTSAPGQGTTVTLWLPSAAGVLPGGAAASDPATVEVRGRTVLVVDDDARVRAVAESMLRRLGCRVLSAADGYEAVKIFSQRHGEIDVVMLDYTMPGLDGFETSRRLRVIRPDVRLLIASGHDEEGVRTRTGDLGGCGFVAKPYTLHLLRQSVGRALHD